MAVFTDGYRELIVEARDALTRLLDESEHDAWQSARCAYGDLRDALQQDQEERKLAEDEQRVREYNRAYVRALYEEQQRAKAWSRCPREKREQLLLDVLGDDRVGVAELRSRVVDRLGTVFVSIDYLVKRLVATGQLDREAERHEAQTRYRYFRRRELGGPIAELERAFHDDGEAVT